MNRTGSLYAHPLQFQRGGGKAQVKKIKRKIPLKVRHIALVFVILALLFLSIQRLYLFLISWEKLNIRDIDIRCAHEALKEDILQAFPREYLGNILLLDISDIQDRLESYSWIKEARIRKVLPSSLKIEIIERKPAVFIKKENLLLIDEEGVELEREKYFDGADYPFLIDENNFEQNYEDKLKLARECLDNLEVEDKGRLEWLDVTNLENIVLKFKDSPIKILLGDKQFAQKLSLFQRNRARWENQFGPIDYIDLRFQDRVYIGFFENESKAEAIPSANKEVG